MAQSILALVDAKSRFTRDAWRNMNGPKLLRKLDQRMDLMNQELIRRGLK